MLYYRGTRSSNPMSNWGHAMFVDNYDNCYSGLGFEWSFDSDCSQCKNITDIKQLIIDAWTYDVQNGFSGDFGNNPDNDYWYTVDIDDVIESFNPIDIVDFANAWDSELTQWFWERIAEPNDIMAVTTSDGAIVFDEKLINVMEVED